MFKNVKKDINRYIITEDANNLRQKIDLFLFGYSLWVIISYRFGRWIRNELRIPIVKPIFKIFTKISHSLLCLVTGIQIPFETNIGAGLYIGHTGMLIINTDAIIGENCTIGTGVIIGQGGRGAAKGSPVIGDNVYIGVGAKVIGRIKIADNVAIGANAVVTKDVSAHVTVAGIPARIINNLGSADFFKSGDI